VLPDGTYVASHDEFGPKSTEHSRGVTRIFRSAERGSTWTRQGTVEGAYWSSLFVHRGALYLLGTDKHNGAAVIRRSLDQGVTWSTPTDAANGLLRQDGLFHCAPMPVLVHNGRLWRAFEKRVESADAPSLRAGMFSVSADADLLDASAWTVSNFLPADPRWNKGDMGVWIEGNAVADPDGRVLNVLRVQTQQLPEKAALVRISQDGRQAVFDPVGGLVDFPGGAKKFTIRFDAQSRLYWSVASIVPERHRGPNPGAIRNTLALTVSPDLVRWTVRRVLLYHPDAAKHGFQYVDWLFEGDDIIAVCRTAFDDGQGGAANYHDANYLTFHRFESSRRLSTASDTVLPDR
jgi:hypothetical protein